jgi:succinate-semialdehyde dehydrogenase/glutarate-semialdehyde dehydrogenase
MNVEKIRLFIGGEWCDGSDGKTEPVVNPATEQQIATLCHASSADLDRALASASKGLEIWSGVSPWERGAVLKRAADMVRDRKDELAHQLTVEQGKPLVEAGGEIVRAADFLEWGGEEGRRLAARTTTSRDGAAQITIDQVPIGVVAALTPWNFPVVLAAKKLGAALGAGCSCILKPAEETPGAVSQLVSILVEAGLPPDVVNLVFGVPDHISSHLIASPIVRKVSFTGSVPVGKLLAARAGEHMKPVTMELGGHSPVVVFDDVDVDATVAKAIPHKYLNAGQVCIAPTRYIVQDKIYEPFVERFAAEAADLKIGDGMIAGTQVGPLANERRVNAIERMVTAAVDQGARLVTGGKRAGNQGYFFEPTVLADVPHDSEIMTVEPFGPVACMVSFSDADEALAISNGVDYGLAAYLYTHDKAKQERFAAGFQTGVVGVNEAVSHTPEIALGGWGESGIGVEGGIEALHPYLKSKLVVSRRAGA